MGKVDKALKLHIQFDEAEARLKKRQNQLSLLGRALPRLKQAKFDRKARELAAKKLKLQHELKVAILDLSEKQYETFKKKAFEHDRA